jgi:hypothetical protein
LFGVPAYSLEAVAGISGAALVTQVKAAEKQQILAFSPHSRGSRAFAMLILFK